MNSAEAFEPNEMSPVRLLFEALFMSMSYIVDWLMNIFRKFTLGSESGSGVIAE